MLSIADEKWDLEDLLSPVDFQIAVAEKLRQRVLIATEAALMVAVSVGAVLEFDPSSSTSWADFIASLREHLEFLDGYFEFLENEFEPDNVKEVKDRLAREKAISDIAGAIDLLTYMGLITESFQWLVESNPNILPDSDDFENNLSVLTMKFYTVFIKKLTQQGAQIETRAHQRGLFGLQPTVN